MQYLKEANFYLLAQLISQRIQYTKTIKLHLEIIYNQFKLFSIIPSAKMQKSKNIQELYQQNLRLGHRLNYLNDENNFYRISINNIKKLNQGINKNLLTTNTKIANTKSSHNKIDPKNITESYTLISNKIQLKNLQIKVGNSKRRIDKLQKLYEGSVSSLIKRSQQLQREINVLGRQYQYLAIQTQLLDNISMADYYMSMVQENLTDCGKKTVKQRNNSLCQAKIGSLEENSIRCSNKLEQILKEEKELKKQKSLLVQKLGSLKKQRDCLAAQVYKENINLRQAQAAEVNKLKRYNQKEDELQREIVKQDALLQEQYKINQDCKQKIMDRNQQETKEIKVLQEQIKKCAQQVKEVKFKCDNLEIIKNKKYSKNR